MTPNSTDPATNDGALTPEERALAARLAKSAPQRGPSAALDASILDAARAAAQPQAAARVHVQRRRRPRWPMITGVAASLTLAFGLAWQLRPMSQLETASAPAARMPPAAPGAGGPSAADDNTALPADEAAADVAAPASAKPAPTVEEAKQAEPMREQAGTGIRRLEARAPAAAPQQAAGIDTPSPASAEAAAVAPPPPPAPPAPLAAPAPSALGTQSMPPAEAPAANAASGSQRARADASKAAKRASSDDTQLDRVIVTGGMIPPQESPATDAAGAAAADKAADSEDSEYSGYDERRHDQPLDDEPPASAEAPAVRDAWLKRVRDLLAHGDRAAARDSLREYQRRNPDAPIPDDLKPLLSE